jgi:hypothetical protein
MQALQHEATSAAVLTHCWLLLLTLFAVAVWRDQNGKHGMYNTKADAERSTPGNGSPASSSARSSTGGGTSTAPQSSPSWPTAVLQKAALLAALFVLAGICMRWAQPWEILLATGGGILVLLLAMARVSKQQRTCTTEPLMQGVVSVCSLQANW